VLLEADAYAPGDVPGAAWALVRVPLDREEEELHLTLRARVRDVPRVVRAAMTSTGEIALARIRWELVAEGADAAPCYVQVQWVPSGDAGIDLRWSAVAGREGFLASVPAGRGRIRLETAGPSLLLERDLELTAGETEDLGRIAVPSLRTVLVRVAGRADLEASPEFAWIRADGEQSWVAARAVRKDGAYPLSLPGGDGVRLFVRVRGVGSAVTDVLPRRGDVDVGTLTLRPEGRIRATVLSETGRSPGRVTTWRAAPDVLRFEDHEVAADGRFAAMLPAGRVRIIIRSEDLGTCEQDVEILPGRTTEATFRLKQ
jgi:hypothetical protein